MGAKKCSVDGCENKYRCSGYCAKHYKMVTREHRSRSLETAIKRCYYKNGETYQLYGGRGIQVCDRWRFGEDDKSGYECFIEDMGQQPKGYTLDRINNDGNYEPSNCRWANQKTQSRNTRKNRMLTMDGETLCMAEWAERLNMYPQTIFKRLRMGWSIEKTLTTTSKEY